MKALYTGILSEGTTSRLRLDALKRVTDRWTWSALDTDIPFRAQSRLMRSLAFRFRVGSAVRAINGEIVKSLANDRYDLIWVDKGVYLWPETVKKLRAQAGLLVHYTPDTAFLNNHSRFFDATADLYDLLITTKSFEQQQYLDLVAADRLMVTTQSYDGCQHRPRCSFADKRHEAVFVGLCESDREDCIRELIKVGIPVRLGGHGWNRFLRQQRGNPLICFEGARVFGDRYTDLLSAATVGLGLLTKRFPELHTTRTFEIPACGTALATERNVETSRLFAEDEAIFFSDYRKLAERLKDVWSSPKTLESIAQRGLEKVRSAGLDNDTVMRQALQRVRLI